MGNQWRRDLQRAIQALATGQKPPPDDEDPEALLAQAQQEMREMHARSRERALRALTQKNQLEGMVQETERRISALDAEAERVLAAGDAEQADRLLREKQGLETTLYLTRTQLQSAIETAEQVKAAMGRQEEAIRQKTAHAVALQAQWKLIKIEQAITLSLAQISAGVGGYRLTPEQFRERHERNREIVIEAVTQKNELQAMVDGIDVQVANLREKADAARSRSDDAEERELLRAMEQHEATLAQARAALNHAAGVTERARALVQEEALRVKALTERAGKRAPASVRITGSDGDDSDALPLLLLLSGAALIACVLLLYLIFRAG